MEQEWQTQMDQNRAERNLNFQVAQLPGLLQKVGQPRQELGNQTDRRGITRQEKQHLDRELEQL